MSTSYYWNTFCPTKFDTGASQSIGEDAKKLGFTTVILPAGCKKQAARVEGIELIPVKNVREAIQAIL